MHRRSKSQTRWKHIIFIESVIEIQMTVILSNADSDVREPVDPYNTSLTIFFSQIRYIKVHKTTRWTIRHDLMLLCLKNVYECNREVTIHRPTFRHSSTFIRGHWNLSYQVQRSWASIFLRHTLASTPTALPPRAIHRLDEHRNCSSNSSGYCVSAT